MDLIIFQAQTQKEDAKNLRDGIRETNDQLDDINRTVTRVEKKMEKLNKEIDKSIKKQKQQYSFCSSITNYQSVLFVK